MAQLITHQLCCCRRNFRLWESDKHETSFTSPRKKWKARERKKKKGRKRKVSGKLLCGVKWYACGVEALSRNGGEEKGFMRGTVWHVYKSDWKTELKELDKEKLAQVNIKSYTPFLFSLQVFLPKLLKGASPVLLLNSSISPGICPALPYAVVPVWQLRLTFSSLGPALMRWWLQGGFPVLSFRIHSNWRKKSAVSSSSEINLKDNLVLLQVFLGCTCLALFSSSCLIDKTEHLFFTIYGLLYMKWRCYAFNPCSVFYYLPVKFWKGSNCVVYRKGFGPAWNWLRGEEEGRNHLVPLVFD